MGARRLWELPTSQCVFATDYPQGVRDEREVAAYVQALRTLAPDAQRVVNGANVEKLIPDLRERRKARVA